jgi:hypothetical protein
MSDYEFARLFMCQECNGVRRTELKDTFCVLCQKILCFDSFSKGCSNRSRPWWNNSVLCNQCWVVERNK